MSAKNWCFTYNGSTNESVLERGTSLETALSGPHLIHEILYTVFQLERGSTGTSHLQGYSQFSSRRTLASIKRIMDPYLPNAHWEKAKGTAKQNHTYCTKSDTRLSGPWEIGTMKSAGKRTDLEDFVAAMKQKTLTTDEIFDQFPSIQARYPRFTRDYQRRCKRIQPGPFEPHPGWQTDLVSYLHSPSDPRGVRWYYDSLGNTGKSYFGSNYAFGLGYVITGGRHADIFYAYDFQPVVFFDWARAAEETFPYGVVESFKNGYFLSTKYESAPVKFQPPHVIIFANFAPDKTKLSHDRWTVIDL